MNFKNSFFRLRFFYISLPLLFPLMIILGRSIMDTQGNNVLLLVTLLIIGVYISILIFLNDIFLQQYYPFIIFLTSLSLIWMHTLTSNYIIGSDIFGEFYVFKHTLFYHRLASLPRDMESLSMSNYNACLSITILPVIYREITSLSPLILFKAVMHIIFAFIPVVLYMVYTKLLKDKKYAFMASLMPLSYTPFITGLPEHIRQEVALFFFSLLLFIWFGSNKLNEHKKRILSTIFIFLIIVSHYSTGYITIFLILFSVPLASLLNTTLWKKEMKEIRIYPHSFIIAGLFGLTLGIMWYAYINYTPFKTLVLLIKGNILLLRLIFNLNTRAPSVTESLGIGTPKLEYPLIFLNYLVVLFVITGILTNITGHKKFSSLYVSFSIISLGLPLSMLIFPTLSRGYGITRLYMQGMFVFAPFLIEGIAKVPSILKHYLRLPTHNPRKYIAFVFLILFLTRYSYATSLMYLGFHDYNESTDLVTRGNLRDSLYIHNSEIAGAKWLATFNKNNLQINCDFPSAQRILLGYTLLNKFNINCNAQFFKNPGNNYGYIYLDYSNVVYNQVRPDGIYQEPEDLNKYLGYITKKDKIYVSNGSEIYWGRK